MCITSLCSIGRRRPLGPHHNGLWEISGGSDKTGAFLCFLSSARAHRVNVVIWDYSHEGDYSNLLILELGNRSVKIYIPISPDNCKQTRLHQYHYHHIVLLKVPV